MSKAIIESLPSDIKFWFAQAVAGLITADGVVTDNELEFLKETITFLEKIDDINKVIGMVKNKEKVVLQKLNTGKKNATMILIYLASIAITDGELNNPEIDFFKYVGQKMGIESVFSEEILEWGKDQAKLNKRKKTLIKRAEKSSKGKAMYQDI